jgi:hypothetical protein
MENPGDGNERGPGRRSQMPWWVWLLVILFPVVLKPWWVAIISIGLFIVFFGLVRGYFQ